MGGQVSSSTYGQGDAASVTVTAKSLTIDNPDNSANKSTGILSEAQTGSIGNAGNVSIEAKTLEINNGGKVSSSTFAQGDAGNVAVNADSLKIDGQGNLSTSTGIVSQAEDGSTGQAGNVDIQTGTMAILNGGQVSSSTFAQGDKGSVTVTANALTINSQAFSAWGTGIFSQAGLGSIGNAGDLFIKAEVLDILNGGIISSSTFSQGHAGSVNVSTGTLTIDNQSNALGSTGILSEATPNSTGHVGDITVQGRNAITLVNSGKISIENAGHTTKPKKVHAGNLSVLAPQIVLNDGIITAATTGNVRGGVVNVAASSSLSVKNTSTINASTSSRGSAGSVDVTSPVISIDNSTISAQATETSSGQTGNVTVTASKTLQLTNQSNISIKNDATAANPTSIKPGLITVSAPDINLKNSSITAESTGNIDAGSIVTNFSHQLNMDPSFITTSANLGNGGNITINGGGLINLQDSGFLTSVTGANGNGGNINVAADILVMNTGVIQANAKGGKGGDIGLNLKSLIPSQDSLIKGGSQVKWQPYRPGFNVIQAASATGVSGNINLTSPQLNISGVISGLDASSLVLPVIDRNPCQGAALDSTLTRNGKGGVPITEAKYVFVSPITDQQSLPDLRLPAKIETPPLTQKNDNQPCAAIISH